MNSIQRFYLDYNASTPLDPKVKEAVLPYLDGTFGNPSSIHSFGREARTAVDEARETIASLIGAKSKEIIFTSGGTESNNLAIHGAARASRTKGNHVITCATEHHAVLHPCEQLVKEGFKITILPVDSKGLLSLEDLRKAITPDTILVSIMSSNNETGTLHPVREIGGICREKKILFHCDAIQSFGKQKVNVDEWNTDLLSITAHKFYGPKGIGALYVRTGTRLSPILSGGFHENERRAGTENVAGIVGMATAARFAAQKTENESSRFFQISEKLWKRLSESISGIHRNGDPVQRLGNTLNVSFDQCDGESLIVGLDLEGIAVSSGSACMVGSVQPSHVLKAMGIDEKLIKATVRFSLGSGSKEDDIPEIVKRVSKVVERLRKEKPTVHSAR
jgi:cysteine desulfurase